jgi:hypothetical protein
LNTSETLEKTSQEKKTFQTDIDKDYVPEKKHLKLEKEDADILGMIGNALNKKKERKLGDFVGSASGISKA